MIIRKYEFVYNKKEIACALVRTLTGVLRVRKRRILKGNNQKPIYAIQNIYAV
jgi:hypothetical protein